MRAIYCSVLDRKRPLYARSSQQRDGWLAHFFTSANRILHQVQAVCPSRPKKRAHSSKGVTFVRINDHAEPRRVWRRLDRHGPGLGAVSTSRLCHHFNAINTENTVKPKPVNLQLLLSAQRAPDNGKLPTGNPKQVRQNASRSISQSNRNISSRHKKRSCFDAMMALLLRLLTSTALQSKICSIQIPSDFPPKTRVQFEGGALTTALLRGAPTLPKTAYHVGNIFFAPPSPRLPHFASPCHPISYGA